MSDPRPTVGDVQAATDVVRLLGDSSDRLDAEEAVPLVAALDELISKAREASDLVKMRLVTTLEAPTVHDGILYYVEDNVKRRDDHEEIAGSIVDWACVDRRTGVIIEQPRTAAARAVEAMRQLYTAPSTTVKKSLLAEYGIKVDDVVDEKKVEGRKLTKTQLKAKG